MGNPVRLMTEFWADSIFMLIFKVLCIRQHVHCDEFCSFCSSGNLN